MVLRLMLPVIATAIVFAGWGVENIASFFSQAPRPLALLALVVGLPFAPPTTKFQLAVRAEAQHQALLAPLVNLGAAASMFAFPYLDTHRQVASVLLIDSAAMRWVGLILFALGFALLVWARQQLGRWFTPRIAIHVDHELIERGPYSLLRHPFYTGLLTACLGFPAVFGSWAGIISVGLLLPVILFRIRVEERLLEAEFGERYRVMVGRTKRLVPFFY